MKRSYFVLSLVAPILILYSVWNLKDRVWDSHVTPLAYRQPSCSGIAYVNDMGRMGNKFFEFLAARIIAEKWNLHLCVSGDFVQSFGPYFIGFTKRISVQRCRRLQHSANNFTDVRLEDYDPITQVDCDQNIKITGFPLKIPAELWDSIFSRRRELAAEFRWHPQLVGSVRLRISKWTENGLRPTVGIHVRRKDYKRHLNKLFGPSTLAGVDYFRRAMDHFREKYERPIFLVVSNDMEWCRANLNAEDVLLVGRGAEGDPGWDLAVLSACDHLILTYGTFGMMAAYFTSGEVISAYNFTSQVNNLVERVKSLNMPNWHWFSV